MKCKIELLWNFKFWTLLVYLIFQCVPWKVAFYSEDSPDVSKRDNSRTHDVPVSVDQEVNQKGQAEKMTVVTELIDNSNTLKSDVENSGTRAHSRRAATKIS